MNKTTIEEQIEAVVRAPPSKKTHTIPICSHWKELRGRLGKHEYRVSVEIKKCRSNAKVNYGIWFIGDHFESEKLTWAVAKKISERVPFPAFGGTAFCNGIREFESRHLCGACIEKLAPEGLQFILHALVPYLTAISDVLAVWNPNNSVDADWLADSLEYYRLAFIAEHPTFEHAARALPHFVDIGKNIAQKRLIDAMVGDGRINKTKGHDLNNALDRIGAIHE